MSGLTIAGIVVAWLGLAFLAVRLNVRAWLDDFGGIEAHELAFCIFLSLLFPPSMLLVWFASRGGVEHCDATRLARRIAGRKGEE